MTVFTTASYRYCYCRLVIVKIPNGSLNNVDWTTFMAADKKKELARQNGDGYVSKIYDQIRRLLKKRLVTNNRLSSALFSLFRFAT